MRSLTLVNICVVVMTTIFRPTVTIYIPNTSLMTDTNYQIKSISETGFNLLTYTSVYTATGDKFVQLDDHQEREQKYSSTGPWFQDGLWTFKLAFSRFEQYVTIHHVLFPGHKLAVDGVVESPSINATPNDYLILTNSANYNSGSEYFQYGIWEIVQQTNGTYFLRNYRDSRYAIPRRFGNEFYKWVYAAEQPYSYEIIAV